ncbi:uncharacterized protein HD556DRAFT_1346181 [Suillus plorans]|uniref:Uncharacterized protein n=1 Tax=Suillus plorans TaxID=116603 RepID=A0A9P7DPL2_9AGAM|nr:uncharacterized protein HD556DRAFT_1346181 [Suillus plorans]KAG1799941.1 hypothetical protein HD556DRAFT_1346181 [Suillus plorans]
MFIDAIIQSNGAGFVGTRGSTMSTPTSRRVQSWHDGATRLDGDGRARTTTDADRNGRIETTLYFTNHWRQCSCIFYL